MAWLALLSVGAGGSPGLRLLRAWRSDCCCSALPRASDSGTLIAENRWLYETLRWGGVAFLLYLAWDSYRSRGGRWSCAAPASGWRCISGAGW